MPLYLVAAGSFWADPHSYLAILMVAVGLGAVIFVHELGHFLIAKACGVKCEKFYIGFDLFDVKLGEVVIIPRALVRFRWGETEYGVGIIPLGGYVKMLGQDDNPTKAAEEMERSKLRKGRPADGAADAAGRDAAGRDEEYELDPRSYQAKTVPQRMAIISAGVIMNLIFAVLFATFAFPLGVSFTPCEIGSTVAGSPAWAAGLVPGDRIIQIGRRGKPRQYIRFDWDLAQSVAANGGERDMEFLVQRAQGGRPQWLKIRPSRVKTRFERLATIGIRPALTTRLGIQQTVVPHLAAARADKPFEPNDRVVAIDGEPVEDIHQMKKILAQRPEDRLTFTVERAGADDARGKAQTTRVDITVPPNPMKRLGLWMKIGEVTAIQVGSPAEKAGFKPGDLLQTVGGRPIGDPLTLAHRLRRRAGQTVAVTVLRSGRTERLEVVPRLPITSANYDAARPIAIDELGIALPVLNVVEQVERASPAARAGLRAGDTIVKVEFVPATPQKRMQEQREIGLSHRPIDLAKENGDWPLAHERMQWILPDTKVRLTWMRAGQTMTREILPAASDQWFNQTRGMLLQPKEEVFVARRWDEAFLLGLRRTWQDATRVVGFLKKLVTGRISPTNLGGPASIAVVATSEASQGPSRLLIFLTFLSANLAVLNFLPIPVLDGGHMVFLTYELVTRRKPSERWFVGLSIAGLAFILSLMLFVIGLDVFRLANYFSSG